MKKLDYADAILIAIDAAGGKIAGRTTIQKLLYLATQKGLVKDTFYPHFYGPYSVDVANALLSLNSVDFLKEEAEYSKLPKSDWKRYSYFLTKRGEKTINFIKDEYQTEFHSLADLVNKANELTDLDVQALSCAAKVHYLLSKKRKKSARFAEIEEMARSFGWNLDDNQIKNAAKLLEKFSLVEIK